MSISVLTVNVDSSTQEFLARNGFMVFEERSLSVDGQQGHISARSCDALLFGMASHLECESVTQLRRVGIQQPILRILEGPRDAEWAHHCANFLDAGGDNLLVGPPVPEEVAASLRAHIRRVQLPQKEVARFEDGGNRLEVHVTDRRVYHNGDQIQLTGYEMRVLFALASASGPVSRSELLEQLHGNANVRSNTIEVFVSRIRSGLDLADSILRTVRGTGYELAGRVS